MLGSSLLSVYAYLEGESVQFVDPKVEGWFTTEDRGTIQKNKLEIFGRSDAIFKIGGENVNLALLESLLQTLRLHLKIISEVIAYSRTGLPVGTGHSFGGCWDQLRRN